MQPLSAIGRAGLLLALAAALSPGSSIIAANGATDRSHHLEMTRVDPDAPPLPGPPSADACDPLLVPRILARLQRDYDALQRFSFREASHTVRLDREGEIRSTEIMLSDVFFADGRRMRRSLAKGAATDDAHAPATADQEPSLNLEQLAGCFTFSPIGPDELDGHAALRIGFAARAGCIEGSGRIARILGRLAGEIWVDGDGFELLRLRGNIREPVTFGFGLLAKIESFEVAVERQPVGEGVFAATQIDYHARGRIFPARRFDLHRTRARSDFRVTPSDVSSSATSTPSRLPVSDPDRRPRNRS